VYLITAVWAILLAAVAIRRHLAFGGGPEPSAKVGGGHRSGSPV